MSKPTKPNPFYENRRDVVADHAPEQSPAAEHLRAHAATGKGRAEKLQFDSTRRVDRRGRPGENHYWIQPEVAAATEVEYPSYR